ncbi:TetR/AcrR family transcriptional regulator [Pengzhenrongella sicca]|uniref:TetR family transcriptional regulator n=1 Tax=Pengzhenrongella sicca TaxID=2819238 RepID=A0A8A4ZI47_9MICO|nr:TetR family transcriptional regulator [Pengzhenrongella sicca]QTE30197.1 TetR family transcriptional regulator [Pengzhenrongella sicca]
MTSSPPPPRTRGPRPAGTDTRAAIMTAARTEFADHGFDGTSMRAVARRAGVDPALVRHYFGAKADLFAAVSGLPGRPGVLIGALFEGGTDGLGRRLVALFFSVWDPPEGRQRMRALIAAASSSEHTGAGLAEFIASEVAGEIAPRLRGDDALLRAELIGMHIVGVAMGRYVLRLEPLASADEDAVARWLAPNLQRLVDGAP